MASFTPLCHLLQLSSNSEKQNKVSKSTSIMNKVKQVLDYNSLWILCCSLILPYLTCCVEVRGNNYKNTLNLLFILQKKDNWYYT